MTDRLFDSTMEFTARAMDWSYRRQRLLASNLANLNTPGYKARDLDFARVMAETAGRLEPQRLGRTHPTHIASVAGEPSAAHAVPRADQGRLDGNTVDLAREMAAVSENGYLYQALQRSLGQKLKLLKQAIGGGG